MINGALGQVSKGFAGAMFSLFVFPCLAFGVAVVLAIITTDLSVLLQRAGSALVDLSATPAVACDAFIYLWSILAFVGFLLYGLIFSGAGKRSGVDMSRKM